MNATKIATLTAMAMLLTHVLKAAAETNQLQEQLRTMGPETFFDTIEPSALISNLRESEKNRTEILPTLFTHCFTERSPMFPQGILRLRRSILDEAEREGSSLFRAVADVGPNPLRLATLEWIAGQSSLVTNPTSRVLAEKMIEHLATDTDPNILIRATRVLLTMPPPFTVSPALLSNTLARTTERVQVLATENRPTEVRDVLFRLGDVIDEKTFQATLGQDQYETLVRKATNILWPLTTQDVVHESASWVLEKFNTPALNEKFYLRATDETKWGRSSIYDQRVLFINRPLYLRNRVRSDCETILDKWTTSFAERNGTTNPPVLREGADAFFQRNGFLLRLAASYGESDLVDRAARHENKWYHELAERARNAFPKSKDKQNPNNGTEPIR